MFVLDAVFFQHGQTGIARQWQRILTLWGQGPFAEEFVVVDRGGTLPPIPGLRVVRAPRHRLTHPDHDAELLQRVCDHVNAGWFLSTYYTTPLHTPSVFMCYDMIPEVLNFDLDQPVWRQKTRAIREARAFIAISHTSAVDLLWFHPRLHGVPALVTHCGTDFAPAPADAVTAFRRRYGLERPYIMLSGTRTDYKNALLVFRALAHLGSLRRDFAILCCGGRPTLEPELAALAADTPVVVVHLDDHELQAAYTGAVALAYPSLYEGFGLPPLEAMACGTPVIAAPAPAIAEVCGDAVAYVSPRNAAGLAQEMARLLRDEAARNEHVRHGIERAARFTWQATARSMAEFLIGLQSSARCSAAASAPRREAPRG